MGQTLKILHLTDLHLFSDQNKKLANINPRQSFEKVVANALHRTQNNRPDLIMLTGDISQDFSAQSYEIAKKIIQQFDCPIAATMGNHDVLDHFLETFGKPSQAVPTTSASWQIITVNSFWPKHVGGKLTADEIKLCQENLELSTNHHVIIFLHHHVLPVGSAWLDKINLNNNTQLLEIIDKYPNIKAVICGHVHQDICINRNGINFYSSPSTSWQFATESPNFKLDTSMPGYRWITLNEDGTMQTEVIRIEHDDAFIPDTRSNGY